MRKDRTLPIFSWAIRDKYVRNLFKHCFFGSLASSGFLFIFLVSRWFFGARGPSDLAIYVGLIWSVCGAGYFLYLFVIQFKSHARKYGMLE